MIHVIISERDMALKAEKRFIGRQRELKKLGDLFKRTMPGFVVIKGRRRIGKSRLIEEFAKRVQENSTDQVTFVSLAGLTPSFEVKAKTQKDEFARQLGRTFQIPTPYSDDWGDLFWHLAHHTKEGKYIIFLDEISWMGMKSPAFLGQLKTAWDQYFSKNPELILIVCGSVSSWIEKNILSSTGFVGRIDLVMSVEELSLPECNEFWGKQGKMISAYEKFKVLSVMGGVPRYLEYITPDLKADELIRQLCFIQDGILYRDYHEIFHDLFSRRSDIYHTLLSCLINHPRSSLDDIFRIMKIKKSGVISSYLNDLLQAGFVGRSFAWNLKDGHESRLSQYYISDNYVRFYLKYIEPNKSRILRGGFEDRSLLSFPGWDAIMGLQFENIVLKNRALLYKILNIHPSEIINEGPYFQKTTQRKIGCQIDYLIQTRYNSLHLCEIKFSKNSISSTVIEEVQQKIRALNRRDSYSVRPILIHVNGVDDEVYGHEFFSDIISFGQFLEMVV